jgi:hypothetical protein
MKFQVLPYFFLVMYVYGALCKSILQSIQTLKKIFFGPEKRDGRGSSENETCPERSGFDVFSDQEFL